MIIHTRYSLVSILRIVYSLFPIFYSVLLLNVLFSFFCTLNTQHPILLCVMRNTLYALRYSMLYTSFSFLLLPPAVVPESYTSRSYQKNQGRDNVPNTSSSEYPCTLSISGGFISDIYWKNTEVTARTL